MYNLDNLLNHRLLIQSNSHATKHFRATANLSCQCGLRMGAACLQEDQIMKLVKTSLTR